MWTNQNLSLMANLLPKEMKMYFHETRIVLPRNSLVIKERESALVLVQNGRLKLGAGEWPAWGPIDGVGGAGIQTHSNHIPKPVFLTIAL